MKRITQRRCRCCKEFFSADYRNAQTQLYCGKPECRKASKKASQRLWTLKNPGHFKGGEHIERVQQWPPLLVLSGCQSEDEKRTRTLLLYRVWAALFRARLPVFDGEPSQEIAQQLIAALLVVFVPPGSKKRGQFRFRNRKPGQPEERQGIVLS